MLWRFACQDCMVFQTRLGYRKKISGPICRTGEGRIYIKVVIILFNAFQWFVKRLNPIASLDFNCEQLWTPYGFLQTISSSVLPFFFPGGSVRFLKNTIFQKSSRQWARVQGHDMGPGIKYHTKKGPDFFFLKASWRTVAGNQCLSVVIEGGLIYQSVYVRHQEINHEWLW